MSLQLSFSAAQSATTRLENIANFSILSLELHILNSYVAQHILLPCLDNLFINSQLNHKLNNSKITWISEEDYDVQAKSV